MKDFDAVILLTPILETIPGPDHKLQVLVALENGTKDKEVFQALTELRWAILSEHYPIEPELTINGVKVIIDENETHLDLSHINPEDLV